MKWICEIGGREVEIDTSDSRNAAKSVLSGEWPVYKTGNQICNPPEVFVGVRSGAEVRVTAVGKSRVNYAPMDLKTAIRELEEEMITRALKLSGGVASKAATLLRIKRTTLCEKMKRYGMEL